ncbi:MAG: type II toxin-antitoxin system HicA family toxin [Acidobacteria bacterium]|nr:type II toxin-antitoxin system HicA family toxin [Acidobacteriota bacterium]MBK8148657.1 type II toxin-antitoxin system HicA family toxin [Acidobacteriota bacterium]MBK8810299.1 type II toxin-antitoxin system HicA family toxin [Acidobacteriota bacterium]
MKVNDVIKLIEKDGWILVRRRGSHRHFHHPVKPGKESVDMPVGTLNSVLKQAGLKR